jgi:hypothetical protein
MLAKASSLADRSEQRIHNSVRVSNEGFPDVVHAGGDLNVEEAAASTAALLDGTKLVSGR